jgi:DNA-binding MarR family transcriptional regulator
MDVIADLGELMFVSRLRRLAERVMQDYTQVYSNLNIDFESRHCGLLLIMGELKCATASDLAQIMGVSNPAVSQLVTEMKTYGLLADTTCESDKRKRWLTLTPKGEELVARLKPVWALMKDAVKDLIAETEIDVMGVIGRLETSLERRGLDKRFDELNSQQPEKDRIASGKSLAKSR